MLNATREALISNPQSLCGCGDSSIALDFTAESQTPQRFAESTSRYVLFFRRYY